MVSHLLRHEEEKLRSPQHGRGVQISGERLQGHDWKMQSAMLFYAFLWKEGKIEGKTEKKRQKAGRYETGAYNGKSVFRLHLQFWHRASKTLGVF